MYHVGCTLHSIAISNKHLPTGAREKPFKCDSSGLCFAQSGNLKMHSLKLGMCTHIGRHPSNESCVHVHLAY